MPSQPRASRTTLRMRASTNAVCDGSVAWSKSSNSRFSLRSSSNCSSHEGGRRAKDDEPNSVGVEDSKVDRRRRIDICRDQVACGGKPAGRASACLPADSLAARRPNRCSRVWGSSCRTRTGATPAHGTDSAPELLMPAGSLLVGRIMREAEFVAFRVSKHIPNLPVLT